MRAMTMTTFLLASFATPGLARAVDCSAGPPPQPLQSTAIAPVADALAVAHTQLGAPGGVLSQAYDESQSLDQVLLRIQIESCQHIAMTTPAPSVVNPADPAAYKPRTEFDNTPWRFNMSQNGKNMTADEFSAWMKSRGVRVARGKTSVPAATTMPTATQPGEVVPVSAPLAATAVPDEAGEIMPVPVAAPARTEAEIPAQPR